MIRSVLGRGLIAAAIAVAISATVMSLGSSINNKFQTIANTLDKS